MEMDNDGVLALKKELEIIPVIHHESKINLLRV